MSKSVPAQHYYFERYECLDSEAEYDMLLLRQSEKPFEEKRDEWLREFIEFSASTNGEKPWSEKRIKEWLASNDDSLEVYGGIRIYRNFLLQEISKEEYDVLDRFIP